MAPHSSSASSSSSSCIYVDIKFQ
jgi:hypothetical protein